MNEAITHAITFLAGFVAGGYTSYKIWKKAFEKQEKEHRKQQLLKK